jgi:YVTN family beta-propeller protein
VEFRILGPLDVAEEGQSLALAAGKQRALLAILLLRANEVVSRDELIDGLWGERPPATAAKSIQISVSQLRKALGQSDGGNGGLLTRPNGYELRVAPDAVDLDRFQRLVKDGKLALAEARPADAAAALREALSLWRGPPLADFTYEPFAQPEIARLEELRANALEERIEADLALGRQADLVGELEALLTKHPLRERLRGQLMLALYRSGRQAEALEVYQQTRRLLVEELGLEPGPELQELEQAILRQDPALAAPPRPALESVTTATLRRPRTLLVIGALVLGVALAAGLFEVLHGSGAAGLAGVAPNALGAIDPKTNAIVAQVPVGVQPGALVSGDGALWVSNELDGTVSRVDAKTRMQTGTIPLGATPRGLAASTRSIWVATDMSIKVIDPVYKDVRETLRIGVRRPSIGYPFPASPIDVAFTPGTAWITNSNGGPAGGLFRADPATGQVLDRITTGDGPVAMAPTAARLWLADQFDNKISWVDPTGAVTKEIPVGHDPTGVAVGLGAAWVADADDNDVKRIDPRTGSVVITIGVGRHPAGVAVGAGAVWVANQYDGTISRIDPKSNSVVKTIKIGGSPVGIAIAQGLVWVTVQENPLAPGGQDGDGGVLRIDGRPNADPAQDGLDFDALQMQYTACARLLNYPDKPGPEGARLQPEVARSMPTVSADGKTYAFILRSSYRFSPPSNERVTAATFKYSIERTLDPRTKSPALFGGYMNDIVGALAYERGKARHIAGVIARGNRLTIRLTRRAGDFPARISMPFFCAVPKNTPINPKDVPIPSAGPYYVSSASKQKLTLNRNPNYNGPRPRRPREIVYTRTGIPERAVERVLRGEVDYAGVWAPYAEILNRRYGSGVPAGRRQFFVNPIWAIDAFALNTSRPLFSDPKLRRAVNYAIDRRALAREGGVFLGEGGPLSAVPTDQYLASDLPGFKDVEIYPVRPDLARARRLAGGIRRHAVLYTCNFVPCPQEAQILKRNLAAIGIALETRQFDPGTLGGREAKPGEPYDLALVTWSTDYPDPYDVVNFLLDGKLATQHRGVNPSRFDDPTYNRRLEAAEALSGAARYRAYARLDADLARDAAPMVAFGNETYRDFFSARIGCQLYQPVVGMDLGALCIKG